MATPGPAVRQSITSTKKQVGFPAVTNGTTPGLPGAGYGMPRISHFVPMYSVPMGAPAAPQINPQRRVLHIPVSATQRALQDLINENHRLQMQVAQQAEQLRDANEQLTCLDDLNAQTKELISENQQLEQQNKALKTKAQPTALHPKTDLDDELELKQEVIRLYEKECQRLQIEVEKSQEQMEKLQQQHTAQLKEVTQQLQQANDKIAGLTNETLVLRQNTSVAERNAQSERLLRVTVDDQLKQLRGEIALLKSENRNLFDQKEDLQMQINYFKHLQASQQHAQANTATANGRAVNGRQHRAKQKEFFWTRGDQQASAPVVVARRILPRPTPLNQTGANS